MQFLDEIGPREAEFIDAQHIFFVATAPLAADGHVNVSPKGYASFARLDANTVAYIDLGGSGIETHAHLRENGRICLMFCAFEGEPLILRLYGTGRGHQYGTPEFEALRGHFSEIDVPVRGIIEVSVARIQRSCGYAVPNYDFRSDRERLKEHNAKRSQEEFIAHRISTNGKSIDDLPGLESPS
jgi:predicted pyridoxine 5'-phosphate oxidase superfamily flavin-nucleotide-binding protein